MHFKGYLTLISNNTGNNINGEEEPSDRKAFEYYRRRHISRPQTQQLTWAERCVETDDNHHCVNVTSKKVQRQKWRVNSGVHVV